MGWLQAAELTMTKTWWSSSLACVLGGYCAVEGGSESSVFVSTPLSMFVFSTRDSVVCTFLCAVNKTFTPVCGPSSERLPPLLWKNPGSILLCAVIHLSFSYRVQLQLLPRTFYLVQLLKVRPPQFNLSLFLCACVYVCEKPQAQSSKAIQVP